MFCKYCGNSCQEGLKFCTGCGAKISNQDVQLSKQGSQLSKQKTQLTEQSALHPNQGAQIPDQSTQPVAAPCNASVILIICFGAYIFRANILSVINNALTGNGREKQVSSSRTDSLKSPAVNVNITQ